MKDEKKILVNLLTTQDICKSKFYSRERIYHVAFIQIIPLRIRYSKYP